MMPVSKPAGLFYLPNRITMNALISYLKHVREEFTHIVWPTRQTAIAHTLVVIFIAAAIATLVGLLDYGFGSIVNRIIGG
jgi:preprotein translocase SecE subunit